MEGDVGTNVVVKVLVIILDIRLEAIFRKSAVSQELISFFVECFQRLLVCLCFPVKCLDLFLICFIWFGLFHCSQFFEFGANHGVINLPGNLKPFREAVFLPFFQS